MAIVVMEGDSWECLPNFGVKSLPIVGGGNCDMERALTDIGHEVKNLAYWGDTIREIADRLEFIPVLKATKAKHFLLGGGGNDLLQNGNLQKLLELYEPGKPATKYLKPEFKVELARVISNYEMCLSALKVHNLSKTKVIVHGYDYAEPGELQWLGEPFAYMGIDDDALRRAIVKKLIDSFNTELRRFAKRYPNVTYVNLRNTVKDRWHDELHPTAEAFADIAKKIDRAIG